MNEILDRILQERNEKLDKLNKVNDDIYSDLIPDQMKLEYLNQVYKTVFGVDLIQIYIERNLFETKEILISEFANNGFFWAQNIKEMQSTEYENLYELMNSYGRLPDRKFADLNKKYCVAKYEDEWFRAYIDQVLPESRLQVFFIDYGTSAIVKHSDTCEMPCPENEIWELPPLLIPCIVKDMTLAKYGKLRKLNYPTFNIKSLKLIDKSAVFELELTDENGRNVLDFL